MTSISTFCGLQTSLRGLLAQQRSLDVTSHNIANAQHRRLHAPGGGRSAPRRRCTIAAGALADGAGA